MPSPPIPSPTLPPRQLSSSHRSSSGNLSSLSRTSQLRRKTSAEKTGLGPRVSSSSSLHRGQPSKANASGGTTSKGQKHHHHHAHIAHTSASKHHRASSFGHRVPSYGKGLNKLTALTALNSNDGPKEHVSIHSIIDRAPGGTSMQRSMSEGNTLVRSKQRPPSNESIESLHTARLKMRPTAVHPVGTGKANVPKSHHVSFSTHHSSDEEDETMVHHKSNETVESPQHQPNLPPPIPPVSPTQPPPTSAAPPKSALREGLAASTPKFLHKSLSQMALVPPKVSMTNAVAKDIANPSTSVERIPSIEHPEGTPSSGPQTAPSSNPTSHFISSTPPNRTPQAPDLELSGIRGNQSSTSLGTTADQIFPLKLSTASHGKLTRTQQKLLLQRASTQPMAYPLNLTNTGHPSPSLGTMTAQMESAVGYFSPLPSGTQSNLSPGVQANISFDAKVAREFDRISRELTNAKRFGDPISDALGRLQRRTNPVSTRAVGKKQTAFGLHAAWKRSPDKMEATGVRNRSRDVEEEGLQTRDRKTKIQEVMGKLWNDEVDFSRRGNDDDDGAETLVGKRTTVNKGKGTVSQSR